MAATVYPVTVQGRLDPALSRWLWIVKWLLAIPHFVVLVFLWVAFIITTIIAGFAILFTGRYPRSLFDFNVGVLRWTWRVQYYAYGALGTDQYPPFTLDDVPDYPAHFDVAYPQQLSRGLVLIKWWLLALPQYLIVGFFVGGGIWALGRLGDSGNTYWAGGLIGLLAVIAGVVLAVTGNYPTGIFDVVLGLNRWVLRVAAYGGLMTDEYPPFRLDMGGNDPATAITFVRPANLSKDPVTATTETAGAPPPAPYALPDAGGGNRPGMGAGRIVAVVLSALLALIGLAVVAGGGVLAWANSSRDAAGFLSSDTERLSTSTAVLASDGFAVDVDGTGWLKHHLGTVRITATSSGGKPVFVGIGPTSDVRTWLTGIASDQVHNLQLNPFSVDYARQPGALKAVSSPVRQTFWVARSSGASTQTVTWRVAGGNWTVVVTNADGSPGVSVDARLGAKLPWLGPVSVGLIVGGVVLFLAGGAGIFIAVSGRRRQ